jgi:hypothetical protein
MFRAASSELSGPQNAIAVFDPMDSAARTAALQLVPENVDRLVRIYGAESPGEDNEALNLVTTTPRQSSAGTGDRLIQTILARHE